MDILIIFLLSTIIALLGDNKQKALAPDNSDVSTKEIGHNPYMKHDKEAFLLLFNNLVKEYGEPSEN